MSAPKFFTRKSSNEHLKSSPIMVKQAKEPINNLKHDSYSQEEESIENIIKLTEKLTKDFNSSDKYKKEIYEKILHKNELLSKFDLNNVQQEELFNKMLNINSFITDNLDQTIKSKDKIKIVQNVTYLNKMVLKNLLPIIKETNLDLDLEEKKHLIKAINACDKNILENLDSKIFENDIEIVQNMIELNEMIIRDPKLIDLNILKNTIKNSLSIIKKPELSNIDQKVMQNLVKNSVSALKDFNSVEETNEQLIAEVLDQSFCIIQDIDPRNIDLIAISDGFSILKEFKSKNLSELPNLMKNCLKMLNISYSLVELAKDPEKFLKSISETIKESKDLIDQFEIVDTQVLNYLMENLTFLTDNLTFLTDNYNEKYKVLVTEVSSSCLEIGLKLVKDFNALNLKSVDAEKIQNIVKKGVSNLKLSDHNMTDLLKTSLTIMNNLPIDSNLVDPTVVNEIMSISALIISNEEDISEIVNNSISFVKKFDIKKLDLETLKSFRDACTKVLGKYPALNSILSEEISKNKKQILELANNFKDSEILNNTIVRKVLDQDEELKALCSRVNISDVLQTITELDDIKSSGDFFKKILIIVKNSRYTRIISYKIFRLLFDLSLFILGLYSNSKDCFQNDTFSTVYSVLIYGIFLTFSLKSTNDFFLFINTAFDKDISSYFKLEFVEKYKQNRSESYVNLLGILLYFPNEILYSITHFVTKYAKIFKLKEIYWRKNYNVLNIVIFLFDLTIIGISIATMILALLLVQSNCSQTNPFIISCIILLIVKLAWKIAEFYYLKISLIIFFPKELIKIEKTQWVGPQPINLVKKPQEVKINEKEEKNDLVLTKLVEQPTNLVKKSNVKKTQEVKTNKKEVIYKVSRSNIFSSREFIHESFTRFIRFDEHLTEGCILKENCRSFSLEHIFKCHYRLSYSKSLYPDIKRFIHPKSFRDLMVGFMVVPYEKAIEITYSGFKPTDGCYGKAIYFSRSIKNANLSKYDIGDSLIVALVHVGYIFKANKKNASKELVENLKNSYFESVFLDEDEEQNVEETEENKIEQNKAEKNEEFLVFNPEQVKKFIVCLNGKPRYNETLKETSIVV